MSDLKKHEHEISPPGLNTATSGQNNSSGDKLSVEQRTEEPVSEEAVGLTEKVSASANFFGSFLSSAWTKTAKTATDATNGSSAFLATAFQKVTSGDHKTSQKDESQAESDAQNCEQQVASVEEDMSTSHSGFFTSALSKMGDLTKIVADYSSSVSDIQIDQAQDAEKSLSEENSSQFLSNLSSIVGKVASDATHVIKDKMGQSANILSEFNKEQEQFIRNKEKQSNDNGVAPWVGYQDEKAMKDKILALSDDKRNFIRAPPSGVTFDFDSTAVAPVALALLQEDPKLNSMRYDLVPKAVKEEDFWRNYFYRVNLIKQSFELKGLETNEANGNREKTDQSIKDRFSSLTDEEEPKFNDQDDEFVSDSYQASSKDMAEVNENMKILGVKGNDEEWEAELESELNEYELVAKDESPQNAEWENEIQTLLEAEEQKS